MLQFDSSGASSERLPAGFHLLQLAEGRKSLLLPINAVTNSLLNVVNICKRYYRKPPIFTSKRFMSIVRTVAA